MKRKRKRALSILFLMLISLLAGCAEEKIPIEVPEVQKDQYVYDQGDFLGSDAENSMNQFLVALEEQTTIEFAVITVPTLGNLSIESYAVKLGNKLGIGKADDDNGILLLISREDERVRLEIGKGLQGTLTDSVSGRILDEYFVPYREIDQYDQACLYTVQAVINYLAETGEYTIAIEEINSDITVTDNDLTIEEAITILVVSILIIALICVVIWALLRNSRGGGRGVYTSFYGSGGGFSSGGGFGGGGFSGGGASR